MDAVEPAERVDEWLICELRLVWRESGGGDGSVAPSAVGEPCSEPGGVSNGVSNGFASDAAEDE